MNRFQIADENRAELWKSLKISSEGYQRNEAREVREQISQVVQAKPTVAEQDLLELLIHDAELRELILPTLEPPDYEHLAAADIFRALIEIQNNGGEVTPEVLQSFVGDSDTLSILLLSEATRTEDEAMDEYLIRAEKCVLTLRVMAIDRRLREIKDEMATAEQSGSPERFNNLILEQLELSRLKNELGNIAE
jgi:hypothetical protein